MAPTVAQQKVRRRELHSLALGRLELIYMAKTGKLRSEVQAQFKSAFDAGRQVMIDVIVQAEFSR